VSYDSGIAGSDFPTQTAAWADYDLDGDLDVYIGNESSLGIRELENAYRPGGLATLIAPSQLFRNEGDGQFVDVALDAGVRNGRYSKGVVWGDFDNDGDPDLYVSNIAGENRLYRNNRDGTFTDVAPELGVTGPSSSFAVWFFDVENDGDLDLYVPSYGGSVDDVINGWLGEDHRAERSRLYVNTGDGGFVEKAGAMGLSRASKPMGANFGDLDGDGALDIYLGTGAPDYSFLVPNVMYRNAGSHFEDVTLAGGFGHLQKGHGVAFVDLDLDGDVDVYEQMGGAYSGDAFSNALYENPGFERSWIELDLEGRRSNRDALLASVRVKLSRGTQTRSVYRTVSSGGSFGSNPRRVHVGFDRDWTLGQVEVVWPLGEKQVFRVEKDSHWRLIEGVEKAIPLRLSRRKL
ncbi:MAG: CRTAC1 family protein, partial [Myxococcota bacterium]